MAINTIADSIARLETFAGLEPEDIAEIVHNSDRIIFRDGQVIVEAGAQGDGGIILISGQARMEADPSRGVAGDVLEAGTLIGETAMLTEHTHGLTVRADGDVRAIKITREALLSLLAGNERMREHFERRLTSKLRRLVLELGLIDQRLAIAAAREAPGTTTTAA